MIYTKEYTFKDMKDRSIYEVISGSHAYGIATPESDVDIRGIFVPEKSILLGFRPHKETVDHMDKKKDYVYHSIHKFIRLCHDCNPSIIETIFIDDPMLILKETKLSNSIKELRQYFLSMKVVDTFGGFARSEMGKMKESREILNFFSEKPTRTKYGLPERDMSESEMDILRSTCTGDSHPELIKRLHKEQDYREDMKIYRKSLEWQKKEGPRIELHKKYGYDTKYACNIIKLLAQCKEIVSTKNLSMDKSNSEYLLSIRRGKFTYEEILEKISVLNKEIDEIITNPITKCVPDVIETEELNEKYSAIIETYLSSN